MPEPSISVTSCRRRFGQRAVLADVTLSIPTGRVAALVGANGSGKTSLLRILAGSLLPDAGEVVVGGRPPGGGGACLVPAGDRMLHWRLTGRMNLEFFGRIFGRAGESAVQESAAAVGADGLLDARVGECSTGQRRRLTIATGLLAARPVILLDEPFADLDDEGVKLVSGALRTYVSDGRTVLFASPTAGDARHADVVFELADGVIE